MDALFSLIFGSGFVFVLAIAGIAIFLNFVPLGLWISAIAAGVNVGIFNLNKSKLFCVLFSRCRSQIFNNSGLFTGQSAQEEQFSTTNATNTHLFNFFNRWCV